MKNKFKFWTIFFLLIIFAAGVTIGILAQKYQQAKKMERPERRRPSFPSLEMIAEELELSSEQLEQIREIFRRNEERLKEFRGHIHTRLSDIRSQLKAELETVLTPEQRVKFEAMIEKYLAGRKKEYGDKREKNGKRDPKEGEKK